MTEYSKSELILNVSESDTLEFKEGKKGFPKDALETYSAFANTEGGLLVLGLKELSTSQSSIVGVDDPQKDITEMINLLQNPSKVSDNILNNSSFKITTVRDKSIIEISIPKATYNKRPIYLKGNPSESYKRIGTADCRMSENEMKAMIRDSSDMPQDATIIDDITWEMALDMSTISSYRQRFANRTPDHVFNTLSTEDFLIKIRAIDKVQEKLHPTMAGLIMFGNSNELQKRLPHFCLEYINYIDSEENRWKDRIIYDGSWGEGNLYNFLQIVLPRLMKTIDSSFSLGDDGITRQEYSDIQKALREAFVNTLMHADYRVEGHTKVSVEEKQYVFSNPGSLRISMEEYYSGKTSVCRNPNIAFMLRVIGFAEAAGSGVPAILRAVRTNKLAIPELITTNNRVTLRINTSPFINSIVKKYNLSEREHSVLKCINDLGFAKRKEIESATNIKKGTLITIINGLIEKGLIVSTGKASATTYSISENYVTNKDKTRNALEHILDMLKKSK